MTRTLVLAALCGAAGLLVAACSDTVPGCVQGKQELCPCPGGGEGIQVCSADNTFGPCQCSGGPGADASTDTSGGDAGVVDALSDGASADVSTTPDAVVDTPPPLSDIIIGAPDIPFDGYVSVTDASSDAQTSGNCGSPCGYGALKGLVCAPNATTNISGALVTVTATTCDGTVQTYQTYSLPDGTYYFPDLPCGTHVVTVTIGQWEREYPLVVNAGELTDHTGALTKVCFASNSVPIAVLWGQWDHQEDLLADLGISGDVYDYSFDFYNDTHPDDIEAVQMLRDPAWLNQYKIIFFNCGSAAQDWVNMYPEIGTNLNQFVNQGGSLYASDLAWAYLEAAFPNAIDFFGSNDLPNGPSNNGPQVVQGNKTYAATIDDQNLADYVGTTTFTTTYGAGPLIAVQEAAPVAEVHVKGIVHVDPPSPAVCGDGICDSSEVVGCADCPDLFSAVDFVTHAGPMVISYQPAPGTGRIVYTTFHNDEQADDIMTKLLYYLVFIL